VRCIEFESMAYQGNGTVLTGLRKALRAKTRFQEVTSPLTAFGTSLMFHAVHSKATLAVPRVLLLSIYRYKNAQTLLPLVAEGKGSGWNVRLWALDKIHPALGSFSRGAGKGFKFDLLNSLIGPSDNSTFDWFMITDDDVAMEEGSLSLFLTVATLAQLSLAQPAHSEGSHRSHDICLCKPMAVARLTTFVEIGPIFAVNSTWAKRILPFPEGYGMGWGLDLEWSDLRKDGARLGIVDLVKMRHLAPVGHQYEATEEFARRHRILAERGVQTVHELQQTLEVWRPWQKRPPWTAWSPQSREGLANRTPHK